MRGAHLFVVSLLAIVACSRREASRVESTAGTPGAATPAATIAPTPATEVPRSTMITMSSSAFQNGDAIPAMYTCDGGDKSPPLSWSGAPAGVAAFALVVEDPDAPGGTFLHWVLYDLPGSQSSLPEGVSTSGELPQLGGAKQGTNGFRKTGYGGPCPPRGPAHHYHFKLYALDKKLGLPAGATQAQLSGAMQGHQIGTGELVGVYARK